MRNSKRVYRYSGTKETVDIKTGEIEKAVLVQPKLLDINFVKVFLPERGYRMYPKEMYQSSRDLMDYLMVVMDRHNVAVAPANEIMERIGLSRASLTRAKDQLMLMDYIRQRTPHVYMVNPAKMCKASGNDREDIYHAYSLLPAKEPKEPAQAPHDAMENHDERRAHKRHPRDIE